MNEPTSLGAAATSKSLVHRFNNFLTLCMTHAEVALESGRTEDMAEALGWILAGARALAPHTRGLQPELPFAGAIGQGEKETLRG
jgi:hypothetical protein